MLLPEASNRGPPKEIPAKATVEVAAFKSKTGGGREELMKAA